MAGDVKFREIRRELERAGWVIDHVTGSHHVFKGPNRPVVVIVVHRNRCKRVYERIAQKAINDLPRGTQGEAPGQAG